MLTAAQILLWILVAIPFLISAVVIVGVTYGAFSLRRSIHLASLTLCPECGTVVGRAAVLAGKEAFAKQMEEAQKEHPNIKFRTIAEWAICCPRCSAI